MALAAALSVASLAVPVTITDAPTRGSCA